jgi:ComF family protein
MLWLSSLLSWLSSSFAELLYPSFCAHCGRAGPRLCLGCFEELEFLPMTLPKAQTPDSLNSITAALVYTASVHNLLHQLKYPGSPEIAFFCAELLHEHAALPAVELITWVPSHGARRRERGFNQAEVIAKHFARLRNTPARALLQKTAATGRQARLSDPTKRKENVAGSIQPLLSTALKPPRSVLLIDDVCTTGATLGVCAAALKAVGVEQVFALTVAHGQ